MNKPAGVFLFPKMKLMTLESVAATIFDIPVIKSKKYDPKTAKFALIRFEDRAC